MRDVRPQGLAEARATRRAPWLAAAILIPVMLLLTWLLLRDGELVGVLTRRLLG